MPGNNDVSTSLSLSARGRRINLIVVPSGQVQSSPPRQKVETGLRQFGAAFARQHDVEALTQGMQMQYVGSRVSKLRFS